MSTASYHRRQPEVEIRLRVRRTIKARKKALRELERARRELLHARKRLEPKIDRLAELAAELESDICRDLAAVGAQPIGEHLYYAETRTAPDGTTYSVLVPGNPDSALDRAAAGRLGVAS